MKEFVFKMDWNWYCSEGVNCHCIKLILIKWLHCEARRIFTCFYYWSDFTSFTLSPLCPSCSVSPVGCMAWVGRGGSGLVGLIGRLGCRGGHGQMLVVGWGGDSCCSGCCRPVHSCASCCSFSLGIVASVCIDRMQLEWWISLSIRFQSCGEA